MTDLTELRALADNPPAFPSGWPEAGIEPGYGMTLRDYFAGQALTGMWSSDFRPMYGDDETFEQALAERAYQQADAMLAARAQVKP